MAGCRQILWSMLRCQAPVGGGLRRNSGWWITNRHWLGPPGGGRRSWSQRAMSRGKDWAWTRTMMRFGRRCMTTIVGWQISSVWELASLSLVRPFSKVFVSFGFVLWPVSFGVLVCFLVSYLVYAEKVQLFHSNLSTVLWKLILFMLSCFDFGYASSVFGFVFMLAPIW